MYNIYIGVKGVEVLSFKVNCKPKTICFNRNMGVLK